MVTTAGRAPQRGPRRASISDVAQEAGVSLGTVSNVLNRPDRVSPTTRAKVLAAIEHLSFVPNGSARQLRAGTITTVGAILLDIANPFFTEVARGIEDRLAQADHTLMLASSDEDPEREARYLRLFEEHGVLGMLVTPASTDLEPLLELSRRGVGVVLLDRTSPAEELSSVAVDDVAGAAMAVEHLLSLSHRRIAFINGPQSIAQCVDRRAGMVRALEAAGLDPDEAMVEITVSSLNAEGGEAGVTELLAAGTAPSALFCVNDLTALGAMRALRSHGLAIPEDMAVVGYDDVNFASMLMTPLTSVRQPTRQLGEVAADLLLKAAGPGMAAPQRIEFQPELVVRASSGGAR
ncbi:LacI family DNA-binding transcriptional regulator [Actinotalea sp. BY-33]|uniref:LacI family DNA-binding transcriptional regulator n=1 Tax=Actinotalea soli TaxID=2819234 RepID=A0A939LPZ7_9CELL|nr:LacI family DNA-binding transcriptional regulator [Actinotalea soli]MBO1752562.1 LacI family DNA-binding transcriptional regulator [Actinotalea soli]